MRAPTHRYEYRINKKGAECYRTRDFEDLKEHYFKLAKNRPGVYTVQTRWVRLEWADVSEKNWKGQPNWSHWSDPHTLKED